jgi:ribose 1,5-bisphosphokinase
LRDAASRSAEPYRRPDGPIGPGRLVLVVGPSGAGKDTLIRGARTACMDDPAIVFPQRVITRPASESEDNLCVSEGLFDRMLTAGGFALWWQAHAHHYGIPSTINDNIRAGRTVVCNVSRTIIGAARRRFACVTVVLVTAPAEVLEERLAKRSRTSDGDVAARLRRAVPSTDDGDSDVVIWNVAEPERGIRELLNAIRDFRSAAGA